MTARMILAKDLVPYGPNQLWVGDITYIALPADSPTILDAWSRLVVGYGIARSIDARLTAEDLAVAPAWQVNGSVLTKPIPLRATPR